MATRKEPLDPQEVLAAAEAAHLAARHTVPISREPVRDPDGETRGVRKGTRDTQETRETVRLDRDAGSDTVRGERDTVRGDRDTVRGDRSGLRSRAPWSLAAVVAAGWAALVSFAPVAVLVTILQAAEDGPLAVTGSVRVAAAGWLLAHGVPLATPAGPVGVAPLVLTALAAWRVARAGVPVTRVLAARGLRPARAALGAAVPVAVAYGGIGALAAVFAGGPGWGASVPRAGLTLAGFGLVAATAGALRATGGLAGWWGRTPAVLREAVRAGAVAAAVLFAAGAAVAGIAVAASGGAAAGIIAAYRTDVAGQVGLTLLCLAYAPNLAGWAAAYLVGPGFAVGAGTVVRSSEVTVGSLPPLPVFAGVPDGPLPTVGALLLAVPVAAGAGAGWLLARRMPVPAGAPAWPRLAFGALVSGVVTGALLGLLAAGSGGPLGHGHLATLGPHPVLVGLFTTATVGAGALLGAATTAGLTRRPWR